MNEKVMQSLNSLCEDISEELLIVTDGKRVIASVLDESLAEHIKRQAERGEPQTKWMIFKGISHAVYYSWKCGYGTIFKEMLNQSMKRSGEDAPEGAAPGEEGEENGETEELRSGDVQQERESD